MGTSQSKTPSAPPCGGRSDVGYRDVAEEHTDVLCAPIRGTVPDWLLATGGTIYRQSGGAFSAEHHHGFLDGLAHVSAFRMGGAGAGGVRYTNKFVRQKHYQDWRATGRRGWGGTAVAADADEEGGPSIVSIVTRALKRLAVAVGLVEGPDPNLYADGANPNVNIWRLGGDGGAVLAAATENDACVARMDGQTLDDRGAARLLEGHDAITSPAHFFERSGAEGGAHHVALVMKMKARFGGFGPPSFTFQLGFFRGNGDGGRPFEHIHSRELTTFRWGEQGEQPLASRPSYMHSVAETDNYIVVLQGNSRLDYARLVARDFSRGFFGLFDSEDVPFEFWVYRVDREDGSVRHLADVVDAGGAPGHIWHLANAFERVDGDTGNTSIIIDASVAPNLIDEDARLVRFTIDLANGGSVTRRPVARATDPPAEFLNVNPAYLKKEARYVYALGGLPYSDGSFLLKADAGDATAAGERRWGPIPGHWPSEPVFVPRPGGADEDDGVLLSVVIDSTTGEGASYLLVLDGATLDEVARVAAPHVVNVGLHAHWYQPGLMTRS